MNITKLKNDTILVVKSYLKNKIIEEVRKNNKLLNIKFMSLDEVRNNYYFTYDEKAIYYLINKYHYKYDVCLKYLNNLKYIDKDGTKKTPVVLHRAILGSLDRFMAYILEETKGALPLWLSPVQVNVIPVNNEYHTTYATKVYEMLKDNNIRVNIDLKDEKLSYKMRESQTKKIPYTLILGDKEMNNNTISYRHFGETDTTTLSIEDFILKLHNEIKNKHE